MPGTYDSLKRHIRGKIGSLRRTDFVEKLAKDLVAEITFETSGQRDSGVMQQALTVVGPVSRDGGIVSIGVGDKNRLGDPDSQRRDTLREFFDDHDEYPYTDWWGMSRRAKLELKLGRAMGLYGGPSYLSGSPAKYFYVQSGSEAYPEWDSSAAAAGITPTHFIDFALRNWEAKLQERLEQKFGEPTEG